MKKISEVQWRYMQFIFYNILTLNSYRLVCNRITEKIADYWLQNFNCAALTFWSFFDVLYFYTYLHNLGLY